MAKFCKECGTPLSENDKFCPGCGTKIAAAAAQQRSERPAAQAEEQQTRPQPQAEVPSPEESGRPQTIDWKMLKPQLKIGKPQVTFMGGLRGWKLKLVLGALVLLVLYAIFS